MEPSTPQPGQVVIIDPDYDQLYCSAGRAGIVRFIIGCFVLVEIGDTLRGVTVDAVRSLEKAAA